MGFHEKSAWACLLGILLVYVPYFFFVLQYPMAFVGLFAVAVVVLVIFLIAFHLLNASISFSKSGDVPPHDELDRSVESNAAKLSGLVLGVAVLGWCVVAMYGAPALGVKEIALANETGAPPSQFVIPVLDVLKAVHVLFAGFVLANVVYYAAIVASYRRLANG